LVILARQGRKVATGRVDDVDAHGLGIEERQDEFLQFQVNFIEIPGSIKAVGDL
jgi:hypothetical protein